MTDDEPAGPAVGGSMGQRAKLGVRFPANQRETGTGDMSWIQTALNVVPLSWREVVLSAQSSSSDESRVLAGA